MLIADLLRWVLPDVAGCPDVAAENAILLSAREFCVRGRAWNELLDPMPMIDGINEYELDAPNDAEICGVMKVWDATGELTPRTKAQLSQAMPDWRTARSSRPVYYHGSPDGQTIFVFPIPAGAPAGSNLLARVVYQPTLSAKSIPDYVASNHIETIASGAKARLMAMPKRAWTDMALAGVHLNVFNAGCDSAYLDVLHEGVDGSVTVRSRSFG